MGYRVQVEGTAREDGPSTWREKSRERVGVVWVTKRIGGDVLMDSDRTNMYKADGEHLGHSPGFAGPHLPSPG